MICDNCGATDPDEEWEIITEHREMSIDETMARDNQISIVIAKYGGDRETVSKNFSTKVAEITSSLCGDCKP